MPRWAASCSLSSIPDNLVKRRDAIFFSPRTPRRSAQCRRFRESSADAGLHEIQAKFREERYAAIELRGAKRYAAFQSAASVPMYEELVVTGAWWDYVDVIASRRLARCSSVIRPACGGSLITSVP